MNSIWSFIVMNQTFSNCSLFDALQVAEHKPSILNHKQCKPLSLPSRNPRQTKVLSVQDTFMEALLSEHPHMFKVLVLV